MSSTMMVIVAGLGEPRPAGRARRSEAAADRAWLAPGSPPGSPAPAPAPASAPRRVAQALVAAPALAPPSLPPSGCAGPSGKPSAGPASGYELRTALGGPRGRGWAPPPLSRPTPPLTPGPWLGLRVKHRDEAPGEESRGLQGRAPAGPALPFSLAHALSDPGPAHLPPGPRGPPGDLPPFGLEDPFLPAVWARKRAQGHLEVKGAVSIFGECVGRSQISAVPELLWSLWVWGLHKEKQARRDRNSSCQ